MSETFKYLGRVVLNAATIAAYTTIHFFALLRINQQEISGSLFWSALVVGLYLYGSYMITRRMPFLARSRGWTIEKAVAITTAVQPIYTTGVLAIIIFTDNGEPAILVSVISMVGLYWLLRFLQAYG